MKRSKRQEANPCKMDMTPMIDVVFQLLIFFIVTTKNEDIMSKLKILRPQGETAPPTTIDNMLTIQVYNQGYVLNGARMNIAELSRRLKKVADLSTKVTVVVKCTGDSPHSFLVKLLDVCAQIKLNDISVFSM